jgi:hypothetical protein
LVVIKLAQFRLVAIIELEHLHSMLRNRRQVSILDFETSWLADSCGLGAVFFLLVNIHFVHSSTWLTTYVAVLLTKLHLALLA